MTKYVKQVFLTVIIAVVAVSTFQISSVMALYNAENPPAAKRGEVKPLSTSENEVNAKASAKANGASSIDTTTKKPYDPSKRKALKELTNLREVNSKTFLNEDGTKTLEFDTKQKHFTKNGKLEEVNNSLKRESSTGNLKGAAGSIVTNFKSLSQGYTIEAGGKTLTVKAVGAANVTPVQKNDTTVLYKNAWPNVDLEYELRGESIKEIIIVKSKKAPTTFNFSVTGGKVIKHPKNAGELAIDGLPTDFSFSSLTLDVNGRGVISEKRVTQEPTSKGILVKLDATWFNKQAANAFPMRIDPTFSKQSQIAYKMFKSDGYACNASNCYANTGTVNDNGYRHWRSYINIPYTELANKTVLNADLHGYYKSGLGGSSTTSRSITMGLASCSTGYSCVGTTAGTDTTVATDFDIDFTAKLKAQVDAKKYSSWWSIRGVESSNTVTFKPYTDMKATITYDTPTPMSVASTPADKSTVVTTQPSLKVNTVTDADGDAVKYYFRVSTNPDGETGAVINSGWISTSTWTVPENILQDGRTYYWHVYTKGYAQTNPSWVRSLKVDMRTGKDSTQAYEEVGPIAVDLATGNATTSSGSHSISALGGDIGVSINYNTPALVQSGTAQKTSTKYGLTGYYYNDTAGTKTLPTNLTDPSRLLMVRSDSKVNFNWGTGAASPGLPTDKFLVRWKGYVTVPTAGSYTLGATADDGVRIKLGTGTAGADQTVYDGWSYVAGNRWGTAKSLPANQPIPITVEYYESTSSANISLLIKGTGVAEQEVPTTWLAPNANILPDGWEMGLDGGANYERLQVTSNSAVLSDSTGQKYEYTWKNNGYVPPKDMEAVLTRNADNTYTVLDTDGTTYIFDAEGKLLSMNTPEDDKQPAALKYEYSGNPSRLTKIIDGVTPQRYGTLHYSGDSECQTQSGFDAAPAGFLCAFKTTDGKKTTFQYKAGNLSRIAQPGEDFEDYGYDSLGRIVSFRDTLANDAIAYGVRSNNAEVTSEITYTSMGKVQSVKAPAPTLGANRIENTFDYKTSATEMHVTGASEPHGFSKKVAYDSLFRTTAVTDLTNLTSTMQWDPLKDLVLSSTDPTGLKSTTIYNAEDMPVDGYGPAPSSWFGSDNKPLAAKVNDVPHVQTGYDEGINGLGVAYYDNKKLLRAPKLNSTATWATSAGVQAAFASGSAPVAATDGWSARYTGKIKLNAAGNYTFKLRGDAGFRLYVDDQLYVDGWGDGTLSGGDRTITGTAFANTTAGSTHRLRLEQYHAATGATNLQLYMSGPGQAETSVLSSLLSPGYGLTTSTKAFDSQLGNLETKLNYSKPEYGLISSSTLDPSGLNLQSQTAYEAPGVGFLRQTSKTLPGDTMTQYQYYNASETRDNPCTSETESYIQAGFMKKKLEADPDGSGPETGRTSEVIYDDSGTIVAARYNAEPWVCSTSDVRGRTVATTVPAIDGRPSRTITNNLLVNGNPLIASSSDSSGTITVENDLLGRTIKYTDAKGNVTTNNYDSLSKLTARSSIVGNESYTYDQYDRLTSYKLNNVTFSEITYDQFNRISGINYPAGVKLSNIDRDPLQRDTGVTFSVAGGQNLTDSVNYSASGTVLSGNENGVAKSYTYDSTTRLTEATIGSNNFSYEFGTPSSSCSGMNGNNPNAAKNGNRTKLTVNGQSTTYCYDGADKLINSSDARLGNPKYDSRGNITELGLADRKTTFVFDSSERNIGISQSLGAGVGTNTSSQTQTIESTYKRDVQSRIIGRETKENGQLKSSEFYAYTGSSDTPDALIDGSGTVLQKYIALPGDVLATIKPADNSASATTLSVPNIHGDIMATVDSNGAPTIIAPSGPFGERTNSAYPKNTGTDSSWSYLGQHQKLSETALSLAPIQMGARVYLPELGRFISVDPIDGGTDNNYVYVNDPVNETDLTGTVLDTAIDVAGVAYDSAEFAKKPTWGNFGMLSWSVAATFVPFVPGSWAGRAGAAGVKGAQAVKKAAPVKKAPKAVSKPPAPKPKPPAKKPPVQKSPKKPVKKSTITDHAKTRIKERGGSVLHAFYAKVFGKYKFLSRDSQGRWSANYQTKHTRVALNSIGQITTYIRLTQSWWKF